MKNNIIMFLLITLLVAIIIGGFTSCNDSLDPIFYTLEQERPIADDSLDNEITVHNVVEGGGYYFAAAPKIFYRATGSTTWNTANMPQSGFMCGSMELSNGNSLFAGFFSLDGETFGLYSAAPNSNLSWTRVNDGPLASTSEQIVMVKNVNTFLLVGTKNGDTYSFHEYTEATFGATRLSSLTGMPADALWDTTNYWVIAGSEVYTGPLAALVAPGSTPSLSTGACFGGIHYSAALVHPYYLSTTDGKIWYSDDAGANWTSSDDKEVAFTKFIELGTDLLVGTISHGYYKITGGDVTQMEREPHYSVSDLYNGSILNFALLDGGSKLFACTAGAGLWRSDDSGDNWNRE